MMNQFSEPTYPITKTELFDEETMKGLLTDEAFAKADRDRLSWYNKHRIGAGRVLVSYKLADGCEEHKLGRLFAENSVGMAGWRFDMRNPLGAKFYWDIDMENCHYRIAEKYCIDNNLPHGKISDYIQNRKAVMAMASSSKWKAKIEFLKCLYGGNIKLYNENYNEVDGDITVDGNKYLVELSAEVRMVGEHIWMTHQHLHKHKSGGKGAVAMNKKPNPKASLQALIFQTTERKMLMGLDSILTKNGRKMAMLIHDGGWVEKLEGETQFDADLLTTCMTEMSAMFGMTVVLAQKQIEHDWKPKASSGSPYEIMKREFEKRHAIIGGNLMIRHEDGVREMVKLKKNDERFIHLNWMDDSGTRPVKKYFYAEWLEDKEVKRYDRIDFMPDRTKCPDSVYNLFDGFAAEKHEQKVFTKEQMDALIKPIYRHLTLLTSGNGSWVLDWLANIIQDPMRRSEVAPLIRDEGSLLLSGGGTGKSSMLDWIMTEIIGEKYCLSVANNDDIYDSFNARLEGKLLVVVEETGGDTNFKNKDTLKQKITQKKQYVNKKGIESYEVNDYSRWMFFTNNRNPLRTDRRFAVFDTDNRKRGNEAYFTKLFDHLGETDTKVAFFQYLKNLTDIPKNPIEWYKSIPITDALRDVMLMNASPLVKWIVSCLYKKSLNDDYVGNLYEKYIDWVQTYRETKEPMTCQMFGRALERSDEVGQVGDKTRTNRGQLWRWNVASVVKHLKEQKFIDAEFDYNLTIQVASDFVVSD